MNLPFKIKEMGIDLKVPAWFVDSECKYPAWAGRFLERFKVKFEKDHDVFELVEVKNNMASLYTHQTQNV